MKILQYCIMGVVHSEPLVAITKTVKKTYDNEDIRFP